MPNNANTLDTQVFYDSLTDCDNTDVISVGTFSSIGATGSNSYSVSPSYTIGTNGTSAADWNNLSITTGTGTSSIPWIASSPTTITQSGVMELRGENADIKINGRSLMDAIGDLEQRLNMLVPNPELEAEWEELRELGDRYRKLEKQCKEKGEMWKKLKSMPPPEVG